MTRRLLQAMAGAPHGGAETFFVRLAGALQRAGEDQRVLIRREPERAAQLRVAGVAVAEARFGGRLDVATRGAFRREIAAWRPDVVLTWMNRATAFCPRGDFVHLGRLGGYYDLKYYRNCDHLIANTEAIAGYVVARGWARDRVHYLPNFVPDPGLRQAVAGARRREGGVLALALGRLHPSKGFDRLLDALALTEDVALWIAGEGPLGPALRQQAEALGVAERVRFLGWQNDVWPLLAEADLLVCPSRHEPLGNVVIEAWAAGVAVVASDSDGPASLIENGRSGLLAPLGGGAPVLAEALSRLAGDAALRARLAAAGRRAYEESFTEAAVVARYRDLFDRVVR
ncbi:MAG TPA: glycosyltransferase [Stellaceae bacterium]|nr:glycosyltransferase [Stellaceae bacterium]